MAAKNVSSGSQDSAMAFNRARGTIFPTGLAPQEVEFYLKELVVKPFEVLTSDEQDAKVRLFQH